MIPLHVTAHLAGPVRLLYQWLALDALLGFAICQRDGEPPPIPGEPLADFAPRLDAVLKRSDCGRLWLASFLGGEVEAYEKRWVTKRPPIAEAQLLGGPKVKTINIGAGHMKAVHRPAETLHFKHDRLDAWAIGDLDGVRELLDSVSAIGAMRGSGNGGVSRWIVEPCEPWAGGFPVVLAGVPLRPLPLDWPGLDMGRCAVDSLALRPPYWPRDPRDRVDVAVPVRT